MCVCIFRESSGRAEQMFDWCSKAFTTETITLSNKLQGLYKKNNTYHTSYTSIPYLFCTHCTKIIKK